MGTCISRNSSAVAAAPPPPTSPATAKVILPDGSLHEYTSAHCASDVLSNESPGEAVFFLCCSDDIEFEEPLPPVPDEEELESGQLYFLLPKSMLGRPLQTEDIAALVAKASSSLLRNGVVVVASEASERKRLQRKKMMEQEGLPGKKPEERKGRKGGLNGRGHKFVANLDAITE